MHGSNDLQIIWAEERHSVGAQMERGTGIGTVTKAKWLPPLAILFCVFSLHTAVAQNSGLCNITNCAMGTCNDTLTANPLDIIPRCQCDAGWKQPDTGVLQLTFLPCVIPNCTLDSSCSKTAPPSAPPPTSIPPCAASVCGEGGSCQPISNFSYVCNCEEGFENLMNMAAAPCVTACSIGLDCSQLGISIGGGGSATPPPNNNKGVAKDISSDISMKILSLCFLFIFG